MKILVVGAGGVGGYFGGRLFQAGRDVTFLVRPRRRAELKATGLVISSRFGDATLAQPRTVLAEEIRETFDLVLLSCKAYDLESAIDSFAPAVGPQTAILPLLNGMLHMDVLDRRFGPERVLGGLCYIAATVNDRHEIMHLNDRHDVVFGERDGTRSARVEALEPVLTNAGFNARLSGTILQEMWEKWAFIATGAGLTCLMRAAVGDIVEAGASDLASTLFAECSAIAARAGFAPGEAAVRNNRATFMAAGSTLTASMLRDIERNAPIEAEHVVGDLLRRGEEGASPLLRIAYLHLRAYEARRVRESRGISRA